MTGMPAAPSAGLGVTARLVIEMSFVARVLKHVVGGEGDDQVLEEDNTVVVVVAAAVNTHSFDTASRRASEVHARIYAYEYKIDLRLEHLDLIPRSSTSL